MEKLTPTQEKYLGITIDYSRDTLLSEQGMVYLTGDGFYKKEHETSPQQTFARTATCYSFGDLDFAQRIYGYVSRGWFMFASPVMSNAQDVKWPKFEKTEFAKAAAWLKKNVKPDGMPISCFAAGTPIHTKYGIKNIEDIQVGDLVLTHKGRFRKVLGTKVSQSNDLYELQSTFNTTKLYVTGNHRMYTNEGWVRVDELVKGKHLLASSGKLDYEGDTVELVWEIDTFSKDESCGRYKSRDIPTTITVDAELAWALGFWFAEGSVSKNGAIRVTHGDREPCERWATIFAKYFGLEPSVHQSKGRNWFNGEVYSVKLARAMDALFGNGCKSKTIPESWMGGKWPVDVVNPFLEGFYLGDGFKTTDTKMFELSNTKLVSQLGMLYMQQGYYVSMQLRKQLQHYKKQGITHYNGVATIRDKAFGTNSKQIGVRFHDGLIYSSINVAQKVDMGTINVYDIQVEEDESFSAAGVIAHNCFLSFIPDTKEGLVEARKEAAWLSMMGGGVGLFAANRSPDSKSTGVMAHLKGYDADTLSYKQTASRRGSMAVYLNDNHPEIKSFITMRQPAGGNPNQKCFNLNNGVNITDKFMTAVINNEEYELVDPKHGPTGNFVNAREIWEEILKVRAETGEPYLNFIDTVNRNKPKWITKPTYHVSQSNLCLVGDTTIRVKEHKDAEPETMRLDSFVEKFELGYLTNPLVESYKDGEVIWSEVSAAAQTAVVDELYEIETPKGRIIRCTGNHKIYTKNRGYVEAQFLEETDELLEL